MANPIKQLAGETAIYGLSTILARIVNFMLVPLYTRVLCESDYGVVSEFMAYIAILQVALVLGLETGCFRYASKEGAQKAGAVFSNAFIAVSAICILFFATAAIFSPSIASAMGYGGNGRIIVYVAAILLLDNPLAILFARLRYEHKALRFAVIKTLKIFTEVGMNLVLYLILPARLVANPDHWMLHLVSPSPDYSYAIFAILVSCLVCLILMIPELFRLRFRIEKGLLTAILAYSIPLMISNLPGVLNDFLDRLLMRFLNADPTAWRADLGIYQAGVKIAVIMSLFVQMFRYAAEPFFFQRVADRDSKVLYAKVMNWFTAFCMAAFLGVMLFMDEIGLILGRDFREGLSIAPIMLMAYVLLGMLFNVNMWYKLSGKTGYAIWVTLAGLAVTVAVNVIWMPRFSYHASAWGHLASYAVMLVISAILGARHYPVPYDWGRLAVFIVSALLIYALSLRLPEFGIWASVAVNCALIALYLALCALFLKGPLRNRKFA